MEKCAFLFLHCYTSSELEIEALETFALEPVYKIESCQVDSWFAIFSRSKILTLLEFEVEFSLPF